jgi:D-3-phosphoglycerate dehydrogenase
MIGRAAFKKMKNTAILVNTARGGIVDEQALYDALTNGALAAAALDAMTAGPPAESPLRTLPNCILTPHAGTATGEATLNMGIMAVQNLLDVLETGTCENRIN